MSVKHVVLGTGAIGRAVSEELVRAASGSHGESFGADGQSAGWSGRGRIRSL